MVRPRVRAKDRGWEREQKWRAPTVTIRLSG
jgi:hypothetical protein